MAISRSQMQRQLYEGGGITSLKEAKDVLESQALPGEFLAYINPQEAAMLKYMGGAGIPINSSGVPSFFIKKIVKGVTGAVKGAVGAVKDFAKSDVGKLALLAAGGYYLGGGALMGGPGFSFGQLGTSLASPFKALGPKLLGTVEAGTGLYGGGLFSGAANALSGAGISSLIPGKGALLSAGLGFLGGAAGSMLTPKQIEVGMKRNPTAVRQYLAQYYKNLNEKATDEEAAQFAEEQTREYAANGGRIGFNEGKSYAFMELIDKEGEDEYYRKKAEELDMKYNPERYAPPPKKPIDFEGRLKRLLEAEGMLEPESFQMLMKELKNEMMTKRKDVAYGGPMGEARENQGGIMELDYRDTGGFVPVGIKEKADDVPAMLSKNEFVFTADAVRNAGNGDVEKGAQRLYNTMKTLENGGTV